MIDWSQAPDGAEFCVNGSFYKFGAHREMLFFQPTCGWVSSACQSLTVLKQQDGYCERPKEWPTDEQRIDVIGSNGPSGEHYDAPQPVNYLRGRNVVVTGVFSEFCREEIKNKLQQLGAVVKGPVDTNTFVVIAGNDAAGVKLGKAKDLGIRVWAEHDIVAYFKAHLATADVPTVTATPTRNKYDRTIHGKYGTGSCTVDVYRVLNAFGPLSPEIDHSIKKLLAAGDNRQDLLEAIQSIEARLQYLEARDGSVNTTGDKL